MASEIDKEERAILDAYERGKLRSVATKKELAKFKAAARAPDSSATERNRKRFEMPSGEAAGGSRYAKVLRRKRLTMPSRMAAPTNETTKDGRNSGRDE
jgi:hypothetical protein